MTNVARNTEMVQPMGTLQPPKKKATKTPGGKPKKKEEEPGEEERFPEAGDDEDQPGDKIVKISGTENIYNFVNEDFAITMERTLLNPDVKYRMEPASKRHRGLTPMMIALLAFVHKTSILSDRRGQRFLGLTQVQYQNAFYTCGISNDTVRDNVRKLSKNWKLLAKIDVIIDKKPVTYYNINVERFPCKDGIFLFGEEGTGAGNRFWAIHCPEYPFCSCMPKDCLFIADMEALMNVLKAGFLDTLKKRLESWTRSSNAVKEIADSLPELLRHDTDGQDYFSDLRDAERDYFAELLYKARLKDADATRSGAGSLRSYDKTVVDIRHRIISYFVSKPPVEKARPQKPGAKAKPKKALDYIP
jgi:hypothetical protein